MTLPFDLTYEVSLARLRRSACRVAQV